MLQEKQILLEIMNLYEVEIGAALNIKAILEEVEAGVLGSVVCDSSPKLSLCTGDGGKLHFVFRHNCLCIIRETSIGKKSPLEIIPLSDSTYH